jgi:DNA-binding NtrC family response regulator
VATAEDGEIALRLLEEEKADLVLLDLQMPRMGGMEVLQRLRDAGNDVPVVIVTAFPSEPNAAEAMKLGAIDFLSKPMTPEALRRVVSEVLARHARDDEPAPRPRRDTLTSAKRALNHRLFQRAKALLQEAIKEVPDSAEPWYLLGVLHQMRNNPRAAAQAFQTAHKLDPEHEATKLKLFEI